MRILITGSTGLVGSECVKFFSEKGWDVVGVDANMRHKFLGTPSKVAENEVDISDTWAVENLFKTQGPFNAIIHAAAQPSHDYSKTHIAEDFQTNAFGTLNLLLHTRVYSPDAIFVHCSTDKIYGVGMERHGLLNGETRYDSLFPFTETTPIISPLSPFGVSKLCADFYAQEFAKQGWLTTGVFRMGCITGRAHEGAELHGFLAYLTKCIKEGRTYKIFGFGGKQVRDQIHARDLARVFYAFILSPKSGEVYNIGGGPERAISLMEAGNMISEKLGKPFIHEFCLEPRFGDRVWDVHDMEKFLGDYPGFEYEYSLEQIIDDLCKE